MGSEFFTFLFLKLWLLIFFLYSGSSAFHFLRDLLAISFMCSGFSTLRFLSDCLSISYMFKASHFSFSDSFFLFLLNCFNVVVSLHGINVLLFFYILHQLFFFFMYSFLYALRFSFSSISLSSIKV